jgi:hypothetical protein
MSKYKNYTRGWADDQILENARKPKSQRALSAPRSVAANNPGALNFAKWQRGMEGFLGKTLDDGKGNVTSVYRTAEDGVVAFFNLLINVYSLSDQFTLRDVAKRYSGGSQSLINSYKKAWTANSGLGFDDPIQKNSVDDLVMLASAMFAHESGTGAHLTAHQVREAAARVLKEEDAFVKPKAKPLLKSKTMWAGGGATAGGAILTIDNGIKVFEEVKARVPDGAIEDAVTNSQSPWRWVILGVCVGVVVVGLVAMYARRNDKATGRNP